jgi:hypothetical protein
MQGMQPVPSERITPCCLSDAPEHQAPEGRFFSLFMPHLSTWLRGRIPRDCLVVLSLIWLNEHLSC